MFDRFVVFGLVCSFAAGLTLADARAEIGSVSAVNRDMEGTPPAKSRRDLTLGVQVFRDERIQTSDIGSGQIIFQDQTSLSIAPRSDMVLDTYLFDPGADAGEVAITLTKGALRFIGGRITKSRDALIRTPTATIGIRGGMGIIRVADDGATSVIQIAGERTTVTGLGGKTVTLSRSSAKADVSASGEASFGGIAESEELEPIMRSFEGGGDGGSQAGTQQGDIDDGTASVATGNSEEPGGAQREPVSTQGEQRVEENDEIDSADTSTSEITDAIQSVQLETVVSGGIDETPTVLDPPTAGIPTDGAFVTIPAGVQTFTSVTSGSLIGTTASGDVVRLPVPESSAEFVTTLFGEPVPTYFAETLYPNSGFTGVNFGEGASLTGFTNAGAFGFSDLDADFHVFRLVEGPGGSGQQALILFGTPTPGQAADFPGDAGTFSPRTNTATFYRIEPDFELGSSDSVDEGLFMVGNGGEPRFSPAGSGRPSNGGKLFNASLDIGVDGFSGEQFSNFSVVATPIGSTSNGPLLAGQISGTDVAGTSRFIVTSNFEALADQNEHTVFGPDGRYIFVTSPLVGDVEGGFSFDTGEEHELGQAGTSTGSFVPEPLFNVLTLDPGSQVTSINPLALSQHPGSRALGTTGQDNAQFDAIHAAGIAACSDGDCGQIGGASTGTGLYSARSGGLSVATDSFRFENSLSGLDTNQVLVSMGLEASPAETNIAAGGSTFEFDVNGASAVTSAYLDDSRFALSSPIGINAGGEATGADFLLASSGVTGDAGIFVGQNPQNFPTQPVNARWGWWSASFKVTSATTGAVREDLFHLGSWVAGVRPDPLDIPASGVIGYGGIAVGTEANFASLSTRVVGGDFELTYDFGIAQGNFRMNIAGLSINELAFGDPANSHAYQINATSPVQIQADGSFFSGASDAVAATGGDFQIDDFAGNRQIVGVFVGDRR